MKCSRIGFRSKQLNRPKADLQVLADTLLIERIRHAGQFYLAVQRAIRDAE